MIDGKVSQAIIIYSCFKCYFKIHRIEGYNLLCYVYMYTYGAFFSGIFLPMGGENGHNIDSCVRFFVKAYPVVT